MTNLNKISLILGGARSGKSGFAEKLAARRASDQGVLYVATLFPFDNEMRERVTAHQASRLANWRTVEAPFTLSKSLFEGLQSEKQVLIDCLTLWTSNLIMQESGVYLSDQVDEEDLAIQLEKEQIKASESDYRRLETEIIAELETLVHQARSRDLGLVMVSNEIGMGLVPPYPLGRAYRDLLGRVNQRLASLADEVFLVVAGIPVELKRLQAAFGETD
jgi:adenosylcobinamide kinase/adenosylcobinamide-phosphate guanylyltransferase